jgi:hypothetical protein
MLKRLAAMGLVVTGGTVISPLATDAKDQKGKKGRRRADQDRRQRNKQRGHRKVEAQLSLPDLPDPAVGALLSIGSRTPNNTYPVVVSGSIGFDVELIDLMRRGRQFALVCHVAALDGATAGLRYALPLTAGTNLFTATGGRTFTFSAWVPRTSLNEDTLVTDQVDEIAARLFLFTRRTPTSAWVSALRVNGLNYYQTNTIIRAF